MHPTVLVVEDDKILRLLISEALSMLDLHVILCPSADEALRVLEGARLIDLVLTDIRMAGDIDGLGLAHLIGQQWPGLPLILTSGHLSLPPEGLPMQAVFIQKPWTLATLHQVVSKQLANSLINQGTSQKQCVDAL